MLHREIIALHSENPTKQINIAYVKTQNDSFKSSGMSNDQWSLKTKTKKKFTLYRSYDANNLYFKSF
jgi:hypothetical protein